MSENGRSMTTSVTSHHVTRSEREQRRPKSRTVAGVLVAVMVITIGGAPTEAQRAPAAPEAASGRREQSGARAARHMVAAANSIAVDAGLEILDAGGSAVDAAIAVQAVLGLVEPQSSGLGGGAFLLHWDKARGLLATYDGRETAPATAQADRFMVDGRPLDLTSAIGSGLAIGVPGVVRLLEAAHGKHGRLPWSRLFEPAIRTAEAGFVVSPRLATLLSMERPERFGTAARGYFFDDAQRNRPPGYRLANPEYATTLRLVAADGAAAFYTGTIADRIIEAARLAPGSPSDLSHSDLAAYRAIERVAVCVPYRRLRVCGMGPPSSGGLTVGQTLALIDPLTIGGSASTALAPSTIHVIAEAEKLAFADRNRYVADPAHVVVPLGLLEPVYIAMRRAMIMPDRAMPRPAAGSPPDRLGTLIDYGEDATVEQTGTSHISIVDGDGNAVSMTTTIESAFGSRVMAAGFLLNNQLTDFSFRPSDAAGRPIANAVGPGKRPRSSMAPTMVFDAEGRLRMVLGSPGGARIILYVVKTLVALVDWRLEPQAAVALLNFGSIGDRFEIEHDAGSWLDWRRLTAVADATRLAIRMRGYGHQPVFVDMTSGTQVIVIDDTGMTGGADPRREGVARGR